MRTLTRAESGRSPTRTAQSKPSPARSTTRSLRFREIVTSGCRSRKSGTRGATCRLPKPAGAVMRRWPVALTPPALTLASALDTSDSRRWQSSRKALPSCVREMRRVVRTMSIARADTGLGVGHIGQQALAILKKGAALMREGDAPRGAHHELDAQVLFQGIEAPPHDGRRHAFRLGRRREAAARCHRYE